MTAADIAAVLDCSQRVLERCDWAALGEIYYHWGGEEFWAAKRPLLLEHGGALAQRLLELLPANGASLWVGAGVAELPVLLMEVMLHGREVAATNLRARECEVLNSALAAEAPGLALQYRAGDAAVVAPARGYDHIGCISVFSDPETWPLLSDVVYGRVAPVQLDLEAFAAEREQARALAAAVFGRLRRPGWITTTAEEAAWFLEQATAVDAAVEASEDLLATAVVGDPVGFLRVE